MQRERISGTFLEREGEEEGGMKGESTWYLLKEW